MEPGCYERRFETINTAAIAQQRMVNLIGKGAAGCGVHILTLPVTYAASPMSDIHLGDLSDLPDNQLRCFPDIGTHGVLVCRIAGQLYAVADNCSHRDAKLSEGRLRGNLITNDGAWLAADQ
jgi:hypothetical protein